MNFSAGLRGAQGRKAPEDDAPAFPSAVFPQSEGRHPVRALGSSAIRRWFWWGNCGPSDSLEAPPAACRQLLPPPCPFWSALGCNGFAGKVGMASLAIILKTPNSAASLPCGGGDDDVVSLRLEARELLSFMLCWMALQPGFTPDTSGGGITAAVARNNP